MLAQLDTVRDENREVLWPTALATPVIRGAVIAALDAIPRRPGSGADLLALAGALGTAAALLETLLELLAVDSGGLQEVWL